MNTRRKLHYKQKRLVQDTLADVQRYREQSGENQIIFWRHLGVTQSGGSRYENTRSIPLPTSMLLALRALGFVSDEQLDMVREAILQARSEPAAEGNEG